MASTASKAKQKASVAAAPSSPTTSSSVAGEPQQPPSLFDLFYEEFLTEIMNDGDLVSENDLLIPTVWENK